MGPSVQVFRRGYALAVLGLFVLLAVVTYVVLVPSPSWWVETVLLVALCIGSPSWGWLVLQFLPPLEDDEELNSANLRLFRDLPYTTTQTSPVETTPTFASRFWGLDPPKEKNP